MSKKIFNSDLVTTGVVTANTLDCINTAGRLTVNGYFTSTNDATINGELETEVIASDKGLVITDKTSSVTDPFLRHEPSVYARRELISNAGTYRHIVATDTHLPTLHGTIGSPDALEQYTNAALVLSSEEDNNAEQGTDLYYFPRVDIRAFSSHKDATSTLQRGGSGIILHSIVNPNGLYHSGTVEETKLHVRSDKVHIEGDLEVTGTITNFTGAHTYPCSQDTLDSLSPGDVVVLDASMLAVKSSQANSTSAVGIFVGPHTMSPDETNSLGTSSDITITVAAVGDTRSTGSQGFNVCNEGGAIQPGDLLVTSSTPGYLMRQIDDIIRSSTVGKAMEAVTFGDSGLATGIYGFLYCG
jgi:hypothetical protein